MFFYHTFCVIVVKGAKIKVAKKCYRDVKKKLSLPSVFLKGCLVKVIYSFHGPIKTDESICLF